MKNKMGLKGVITESQFYMWRTLFAMAHADDVVTDEEIRFMMDALEDIPFTPEQMETLKDDIGTAQNIEDMFKKITDDRDQAMFFSFARDLVWIDGDYGAEEQEIMLKLKRLHIQSVDVDKLIGNVGLQLEGDDEPNLGSYYDGYPADKSKSRRKILFSFRDRFLKDKIRDK